MAQRDVTAEVRALQVQVRAMWVALSAFCAFTLLWSIGVITPPGGIPSELKVSTLEAKRVVFRDPMAHGNPLELTLGHVTDLRSDGLRHWTTPGLRIKAAGLNVGEEDGERSAFLGPGGMYFHTKDGKERFGALLRADGLQFQDGDSQLFAPLKYNREGTHYTAAGVNVRGSMVLDPFNLRFQDNKTGHEVASFGRGESAGEDAALRLGRNTHWPRDQVQIELITREKDASMSVGTNGGSRYIGLGVDEQGAARIRGAGVEGEFSVTPRGFTGSR